MYFVALVAAKMSKPTDAKRSSGFDFRDRTVLPADVHPDLPPTNLQRNKSERVRLQGLMRSDTISVKSSSGPFSGPDAGSKKADFKTRFQTWMVNEGTRRIFFGLFILLHVLVGVLGTLHYALKSNLSGARATFGSTFGKFRKCMIPELSRRSFLTVAANL